MESDKCVEYKNVAMDLLVAYLESKEVVIIEHSGNFKRSALELKKQVLGYLKRLDEGEDTFNELVKDMWIFDHYKAESEDKDTDKCTYKETGCGSCKRQLDCPMNADKAESEDEE